MQFILVFQRQSGSWVTHRPKIVRHYLKGWFALDFITIAISAFDIIAVHDRLDLDSTGDADESDFTNLKVPRFLLDGQLRDAWGMLTGH